MVKHGWRLVDAKTGTIPAMVGQTYKNFRGEPRKLLGGMPPLHPGSTGRVETDAGSFFPNVIDLKWVEV